MGHDPHGSRIWRVEVGCSAQSNGAKFSVHLLGCRPALSSKIFGRDGIETGLNAPRPGGAGECPWIYSTVQQHRYGPESGHVSVIVISRS